ncbi:M42 family metallopeptidase [Inediibacterium massiliense]|uniref:M42 family metallopeptidase n=1 Tax=Inediibacterium massiliense TaxID=1658111 RepID=UPI0006B5F75D|nr:M42 family metallopeptidase [Inediibacterium massiliense]
MENEYLLKEMLEGYGVSGYEHTLSDKISSFFKEYADEIYKDKLGNIIIHKKGTSKNPIKIMLAAHMDEIGLMVKDIDKNGFIKFTNIGGVDQRTLLAQEVIIHGKEEVFGIIGTKPPHLQDPSERNESIKSEDLLIDVGLSYEKAKQIIEIGDTITIKRNMVSLKNNKVAGKALDDRAGILAMIHCFKELQNINHDADVYAVCTIQEEVGTRGAMVSAYEISPHIGIAIDVGFGSTPELSKDDTLDLGKGPGICIGANIHPNIHHRFQSIGKEYNIPYQVEISPGNSGTDARSIQIARCGVATGLLSIPLRYMHTSVETIDLSDIKYTARMLAYFISSLNGEDWEGFLCY